MPTSSPALPELRRVVTGHNSEGLTSIHSDGPLDNNEAPAFPGVWGSSIWITDSTPTDDNNNDVDGASRTPSKDLGIVQHGGTVFRYTDLAPGAASSMHRTSSLDYNVLIQGILVLVLEDGSETVFQTPGDVIIQRGTIHEWRNPGPDWTRWLTVLVDANPVVVNGETLGLEVRR